MTTAAEQEKDARVVDLLRGWFSENARALPWRTERRNPYAVWLSEVMLQQTRVDTVIPYFQRFLLRYPDVSSLAAAELDSVLELWSGLGYYRRARELHAAAREVCERYGGELPREASELRGLRGVGAYTAGAIASIAHGRREPLVDGNVARVLARLYGITGPVDTGPVKKRLWALAGRLVPARAPGAFNEALMELGALVCTPREPRCGACPVSHLCVAQRTGRTGELPESSPSKRPKKVDMVAFVIVRKGEALLGQRPRGGLFGGLWEPPMVEAKSVDAARKAFEDAGVGALVTRSRTLGSLKHVLSHRELAVSVVLSEVRRSSPGEGVLGYERFSWATLDVRAPGVGVSSLSRKILAAGSVALGKAP